jgi:Heparinase II/III-like protein/Domain of unknown function (DUF4962)
VRLNSVGIIYSFVFVFVPSCLRGSILPAIGTSRLGILILVTILAISPNARAADDVPDDPLKNLRPGHPRLMVLDDQLPRIKELIKSDPLAATTFKRLLSDGEKMLKAPPMQHVLVGPRLLAQSRGALTTITTLAGLYRLTGDVRFADRAKEEMLAVAAFPDWNPSHFLDVAEMTNACGIGYDWIYDRLSDNDRKTIRQAIIEKGLNPGLNQYAKKAFWINASFNWAQVCGGGLTVGALAIADEEPDIARKILGLTRGTMTTPMKQFAPDGGWDEGPTYWSYATRYNVYYLSAIETALGTDYGLDQMPGFADAGMFHIHSVGPTHKYFNFADAGDTLEPCQQMFWFAQHFNRPMYAAWERLMLPKELNIFHLLWFDPAGTWPGENSPPLDALFRRIDVGFFRSSWTNANAWYVGFKGGDNTATHSHLDLGTFVLDAMGQRWAAQLGPDNYNLPDYFGRLRWTYYRLRTEGQNTLTLYSANQLPTAKAKVIAFSSTPQRASAVIDLSAGYPASSSAQRGISMFDRQRVLLQDEITLPNPADIVWNFHTPATIDISSQGNQAVLTIGKAKMKASILVPSTARFEVISASPPPPQKPNPGISNLTIKLIAASGEQRIAVLFAADGDKVVPKIEPLNTWPKE